MNTNNLPNTLLTGAVAGALGTLAMDLLLFRRARQAGSDDEFSDWEFTGEASFDDAGALAQVGQEVAGAVGVDLPDRAGGLTGDVVHWLTGTGWGVGGSLLAAMGLGPVAAGLTSGAAAFTAAYTVLPTMGLYDPIWDYDGKTLWKDATAHATFGAATGIALGVLRRVSGRSSD